MGNAKSNAVSQWFSKRRQARHKGSPIIIGNQPTTLLDRYGRELQEGDEVMLPGFEMKSPSFLVAEVAPLIDLNAPPNLLRVRLTTVVTMGIKANAPDPQVIKVRDVLEVGFQTGVRYQPEVLAVLRGEELPSTPPSGGGESPAPDASALSASADGSPRAQSSPSGLPSLQERAHVLTGLREQAPRREDASPLGEKTTRLVLP